VVEGTDGATGLAAPLVLTGDHRPQLRGVHTCPVRAMPVIASHLRCATPGIAEETGHEGQFYEDYVHDPPDAFISYGRLVWAILPAPYSPAKGS